MSIEQDLSDLLEAIRPGAVYPDVAPQGVPEGDADYIVWQQIGGVSPAFLENAMPSVRNTRVQISCWCKTKSGAIALGLEVEAALAVATALSSKPMAAFFSTHDPVTDRRGTQQDFGIWGPR